MLQKIKQYCRYCAFCSYGDIAYCGEYDKTMSDSTIRRENHCKRFAYSELGDVETGKQYQPRREKTQEEIDLIKNQVKLF